MIHQSTTKLRHWAITAIGFAVLIALGYMGDDQLNDQLISESILCEINIANKTTKPSPQSEIAALDARARYLTAIDHIAQNEAIK